MKLMISACLMGEICRYDGKSKPLPSDVLTALKEKYTLVPVCPEVAGGLPTPRLPSEIVGDRVMRRDGHDVTDAYARGAEYALCTAQKEGCRIALLKEKSPSCGKGIVYDGTFSGTLKEGNGRTVALLMSHGIKVFGESEIAMLPESEP